ncbi:MAG: ABC transporter permease subunit [Clostridiales bacterium]|jgi:putative aldouronate transport system permease protein|nr:ABC transporter permease subunit [Clostridiales bacterium]
MTKQQISVGRDVKTQVELHGMLLPGTLLMIVFSIVPLFGLLIAFKNFKPAMGFAGIFTSPWNHFSNFKQIFRSSQFAAMMRNTLGINLFGTLISMTVTIAFAMLLNELRGLRFKSAVQTVTYMPHFLSWVVFGGLCINILSPDGGVVNKALLALGLADSPVLFLADPKYFWWVAIFTGLLKDIGWGAILYLAAISGIDPALYEAATIDGAGRLKKMRYITLTGMMPTVMIMLIFAVSGMLNNNFTQIYVFQNVLNMPASQVIDTYVYQIGLQQFQFGIAAAVSLTKSVFALLLMLLANYASKKLTDSTGIF